MSLRRFLAERPRLLVLFLLALCVLVLAWMLVDRERSGLRVTFLDVGQGDAVLIESPSGVQVLYDGGPGAEVLAPLARAMPLFDRSIDLVIASHPDRDHIAGLVDVFARYTIGAFMEPGVRSENGTYDALSHAVHEEPSPRMLARAGGRIDIGGGATLEILFPDRDVANMETNSASIVMLVRSGDTALLLSGDLPIAIEEYLASIHGTALHADILKLGHHGSRTSSSAIFLSAVDPRVAVISAGCGNSYGHPHKEVLERLTKAEIEPYLTCALGSISFESDGQDWALR